MELSSSLFKSGDNTIAVEIHNNSYTSSDQFWDAELLTTIGSASDEIVSPDPVIDIKEENNKQSLIACFTPLSEEAQAEQGITPVRINEISAANGIYVNDYFKRNDWVELYNTTSQPVDVEGMFLSDNEADPKKYQITKGETKAETVIPAHGHLIVWCDKLETETLLHANFKLDADGGLVMLTAADESWTDKVTYGLMKEDQTVGRYPDGTSDIFVYTGNVNGISIGDKVAFQASKVTYNGVPEATTVTDLSVESSGNNVSYPEASDITTTIDTYESPSCIFVALVLRIKIIWRQRRDMRKSFIT
jgi:hypothetical protein